MPRHIAETVPTKEVIIIKELTISNQILVKEKEVLIKEYSVQSGTLNFKNVKKANIIFSKSFQKIPRVSLTLLDTSVTNPYVSDITNNGFKIEFQNNWSGNIEWMAVERE